MNLLIDIGGTNTRIATTTDTKSFTKPVKCPTSQDFAEQLENINQEITKLQLTEQPQNVAIAMPGSIDPTTSFLTAAPNLPRWHQLPLQQQLEQALGTPVHIKNDADLGGLGEAVFGPGKDYTIVAFLTVSTGVGGTRIVNGRLDPAPTSSEPGFQIIDASGTLCPECPKPTTLEQLVGGAALAERQGMAPKEIKDETFWETLAAYLALGLNNITAMWSPEIIIIGGPMMNDIPIEQAAQHLDELMTSDRQAPAVVPATLGDDRNLYGALAYLNSL